MDEIKHSRDQTIEMTSKKTAIATISAIATVLAVSTIAIGNTMHLLTKPSVSITWESMYQQTQIKSKGVKLLAEPLESQTHAKQPPLTRLLKAVPCYRNN